MEYAIMRNEKSEDKADFGLRHSYGDPVREQPRGILEVEKLAASRSGSFEAAVENETLILVMQAALDQQRSGVRSYLLGGSTLEELEAGKQRFQNAADKLPPLLRTDEGRNLFAHLLQTVNRYRQLRDRSLELRRAGKTKEAVALCLSPEALQAHESVIVAMEALGQTQESNKSAALREHHSAETGSRLSLATLALVGLVFQLVRILSFFVPRSLTRSISGMTSGPSTEIAQQQPCS